MKSCIWVDLKILRQAYRRFDGSRNEEYCKFLEDNREWLDEYCLFMALKNQHGGVSWREWEAPYRDRDEKALEEARGKLAEEIDFYRFQQFEFNRQWKRLHAYANEKGIEIIGDIPIYVAFDSADTWAAPELFQFDENKEPAAVAGCPPDGFSATGQLWGNPLYDWEYHRKTGYAWWMRRIAHCFRLYDIVRIDHFRGLMNTMRFLTVRRPP